MPGALRPAFAFALLVAAAPAVACGANAAWINGNVVVDRDRFDQDRKFGVSLADGRVVFGVSGNGTGDRTICGTTDLRDNQWHHVAVQRRRSDGFLRLWVDNALQASLDGPDGDVSYPDNGMPGSFCGPGGNQPCTGSDPFLVLGAEKHDAGTPAAGTQDVYAQSVGAGNGTLPDAAQTLTVLVVDACGGFADVASTDGHCNAIEWMRNRAVTIGCAGNLYCPSLAVIRASMALFQQRLGGVLSPVLGYTEAAGGALALATQEIVCASADLTPANHPRDVEVRYRLSTQATGALTLGVTVVTSRNGGATWEPATQTRMRAQTAAAQWRATSGFALAGVAAGEAVRFALALDREAGAASLGATNCRVATMAVNRNASAPPRDAADVLPT